MAEIQQLEASLLRQRVLSMELEIERHKAVEQALRAALAGHRRESAERQRVEMTLRAAKEEAERANRAKSEFIAVMSHELRTPLNAIVGYQELLSEGLSGPLTPEQHDRLSRIRNSALHLRRLIDNVLELARIEAGRVEYRLETIRVGHAVARVSEIVEPLLASKQISYDAAAVEPKLTARADPDRLDQILLNLVSNAVKFTTPGGHVRVEAEARSPCAGIVAIRVRDDGCGIPSDQQSRIFDPYVQVADGISLARSGTGLGLAISRDLARGMGGELSVESQIGEGSVFTLALPRVQA